MPASENLIFALLRDIRQEIAGLRTEDRENRSALSRRIGSMNTSGLKAPKGFVGHRNMTERIVASFDDHMSRIEVRLAALETARA